MQKYSQEPEMLKYSAKDGCLRAKIDRFRNTSPVHAHFDGWLRFFPKKGKRYMRLSVYLYGGMFGLFTCKPCEY